MWDMREDVKNVLLIVCCKKGVEFFTVMKQKIHNGNILVVVKRKRLKEVSEKMK